MTQKRRIKTAAVAHWVPATRDEVNAAIQEIGEAQRERLRIETRMNDAIARVKAHHDAKAKPHADRIEELSKGVQLYCEANKAVLTEDGKVKTHVFATGDVSWRTTPPSVVLRGVEAVIAYLLASKLLKKYLRKSKWEVNKEALLKDRDEIKDSIPGVTFAQREEFAIKPNESKIEQVQK